MHDDRPLTQAAVSSACGQGPIRRAIYSYLWLWQYYPQGKTKQSNREQTVWENVWNTSSAES